MMKCYAQWLVFGFIFIIPAVSFAYPGSKPTKPPETAASKANAEVPAPMQEKKVIKGDVPTKVGKVLETMNGGGYTYVYLEDKEGTKKWYAVPESTVKVGQELELMQGTDMGKFTSKALNRTFDSITFSGGIVVADDQESIKQAHQNVKKNGEETQEAPIKVEKAAGANAYTVGEIYSKKEDLAGKSIAIKGKVVKVSSGILGKNWIHLRDGSGDGSKGTNDLILTSQDVPKIGDIITVTGELFTNKDFGSGYKYDVIMENATIKQ